MSEKDELFTKDFAYREPTPAWEEIDIILRSQESSEERSIFDSQLLGYGPSNSQSLFRLFNTKLPKDVTMESYSPEVTLYRDSAGWCPYCEKVWLQLEEKEIPYKVVKIPMRCYGEKPSWFMQINRSGAIPVAVVKGITISESNDIIDLIEKSFPCHKPLRTYLGSPKESRVQGLLALERKVFSVWFQWLTSRGDASAASTMDRYLTLVDEELAVDSEGPYFLGEFSLVDIMFTPFLERMAASLPYFKGFQCRSETFPHLLKWYEAMDRRDAYRGIKSDYYTHCHDLPPQIGQCYSLPQAKEFADEIDGGAWSLERSAESLFEPMLPIDERIAAREAARRVIHNHENIVRFACRGRGAKGSPSVSAPLADPNCRPNLSYEASVDEAMRRVVLALSLHTSQLNESPFLPAPATMNPRDRDGVIACLSYLRDRVGVPRDMSNHAARLLRAHINKYIADSTVQST